MVAVGQILHCLFTGLDLAKDLEKQLSSTFSIPLSPWQPCAGRFYTALRNAEECLPSGARADPHFLVLRSRAFLVQPKGDCASH